MAGSRRHISPQLASTFFDYVSRSSAPSLTSILPRTTDQQCYAPDLSMPLMVVLNVGKTIFLVMSHQGLMT